MSDKLPEKEADELLEKLEAKKPEKVIDGWRVDVWENDYASGVRIARGANDSSYGVYLLSADVRKSLEVPSDIPFEKMFVEQEGDDGEKEYVAYWHFMDREDLLLFARRLVFLLESDAERIKKDS